MSDDSRVQALRKLLAKHEDDGLESRRQHHYRPEWREIAPQHRLGLRRLLRLTTRGEKSA